MCVYIYICIHTHTYVYIYMYVCMCMYILCTLTILTRALGFHPRTCKSSSVRSGVWNLGPSQNRNDLNREQ